MTPGLQRSSRGVTKVDYPGARGPWFGRVGAEDEERLESLSHAFVTGWKARRSVVACGVDSKLVGTFPPASYPNLDSPNRAAPPEGFDLTVKTSPSTLFIHDSATLRAILMPQTFAAVSRLTILNFEINAVSAFCPGYPSRLS